MESFRVIKRFALEGTVKIILFQPPRHQMINCWRRGKEIKGKLIKSMNIYFNVFFLGFPLCSHSSAHPQRYHSWDWGHPAAGTAPAPLTSPRSCQCHRQPRIPPPRLSPCRSEPSRAERGRNGSAGRNAAPPPRRCGSAGRSERRGCGSAGRDGTGGRRDAAGVKGGETGAKEGLQRRERRGVIGLVCP